MSPFDTFLRHRIHKNIEYTNIHPDDIREFETISQVLTQTSPEAASDRTCLRPRRRRDSPETPDTHPSWWRIPSKGRCRCTWRFQRCRSGSHCRNTQFHVRDTTSRGVKVTPLISKSQIVDPRKQKHGAFRVSVRSHVGSRWKVSEVGPQGRWGWYEKAASEGFTFRRGFS